MSNWFRVTLSCACPAHIGPELAGDLQTEFRDNYPHEHEVTCTYEDGKLLLASTNEYNPDGLNLMDEFSDMITAYSPEHFDGDIELLLSEPIKAPVSE